MLSQEGAKVCFSMDIDVPYFLCGHARVHGRMAHLNTLLHAEALLATQCLERASRCTSANMHDRQDYSPRAPGQKRPFPSHAHVILSRFSISGVPRAEGIFAPGGTLRGAAKRGKRKKGEREKEKRKK